jgi:hypothetical protein
MSRSFKKTPMWTDDSMKRFGKHQAVKSVRRRNRQVCREYFEYEPAVAEQHEIDSSGVHRIFESYDISDFSFFPFNEEDAELARRK